VVIVVAGHDRNLGAGRQRAGQIGAEPLRRPQRVAHRTLAQLEHIAEQDETIDPLQRSQQSRPRLLTTQQIKSGERPQMEVGDDQRTQLRPRASGRY
jgi:hypothetical protein